jgi:PTS system nitrogen regulatory IIA component
MRMRDFVVRDAINPDLKAESKEAVIRERVDNLRQAGYLKGSDATVGVAAGQPAAAEDIVKAILKRELLGSTGIGRNVAIPHAKHTTIDRLIGTVAVSKNGIPFDSLDGEPVYVFVMLISPQDRPGDHLRALENVSRSLRDDSFVRALRQAPTREAIWELLGEQS